MINLAKRIELKRIFLDAEEAQKAKLDPEIRALLTSRLKSENSQ